MSAERRARSNPRPDPSRRRACSRGCRFLDPACSRSWIRVPGSESQVDPSARIRVAGGPAQEAAAQPPRRRARARLRLRRRRLLRRRLPRPHRHPVRRSTPPAHAQTDVFWVHVSECVCGGEEWGKFGRRRGKGGGDSGGICRRVRLTSARSLAPRERPPTVHDPRSHATAPSLFDRSQAREFDERSPACLRRRRQAAADAQRGPAGGGDVVVGGVAQVRRAPLCLTINLTSRLTSRLRNFTSI